MSIQALNWAWKQEKLTSREKLVLIALADQADDNGVCWPSVRYLSRKTGISKSAIQRTLFLLNGPLQLMLVISRTRSDGGTTSPLYRLNLSNVPLWQDDEVAQKLRSGDYSPLLPPAPLSHPDGTAPVPPKRDTLSHPDGTPCPTAMTPAEEPSVNHQLTKPCAQGFARFWDAYPKKRSKGTAERAYKRMKPSEQLLETILSSLGRAKTSEAWLKDGGQFIPYPATWLNARGWEDEEKVDVVIKARPNEFLAKLNAEVRVVEAVSVRQSHLEKLRGALK